MDNNIAIFCVKKNPYELFPSDNTWLLKVLPFKFCVNQLASYKLVKLKMGWSEML